MCRIMRDVNAPFELLEVTYKSGSKGKVTGKMCGMVLIKKERGFLS